MRAAGNTGGVHCAWWLDSPLTAVGWGQSSPYPNQEGTSFGNIFAPKSTTGKVDAFYCNGPSWDRSVVPGRPGAYQDNAPYTNPFGQAPQCKPTCTATASPTQNHANAPCKGYNTPITVCRQNAPTFGTCPPDK